MTLFYLANDVIQHAKRKGFPQFVEHFADVLKKATLLCKDDKISSSVDRVFNIWHERNIYSEEKIQEFRELLSGTSAKLAAVSKIVAEFKLSELIDKIKKVRKAEQTCASRLETLTNCKVDATSGEVLNKLKDKTHGEQFTRDVDEATKCLESVISALEKEVLVRHDLVESLEKSEIFYETQKEEAETVVDAYKNFGLRVKNVWRKLKESSNSLPSPIPSPPRDAPSPTNSDDGPNLPMADSFGPDMNALLRQVVADNSHDIASLNQISSLDQRLSTLMHSMPHVSDSQKTGSNQLNPINTNNTSVLLPQMQNISNNTYVNENPNNSWIQNPMTETNINVNYVNDSMYSRNASNVNYEFGYTHPIQDYSQPNHLEVQPIQSLVSSRGDQIASLIPSISTSTPLPPFAADYSNLVQPSENFEPADMDLGNSDEEDNLSRGQTHRTIKVIDTRRNSNEINVGTNATNDRRFSNNVSAISNQVRPYLAQGSFAMSSPQLKSVARMPVRNSLNNVQQSHPYPHPPQWRTGPTPRSAVVAPQHMSSINAPLPQHNRNHQHWRSHNNFNNRNNRKARY